VNIHPLREAREEQEATDLKSKLSQIIYQGIVDRLKQGPVHADDLEPLFAEEVRDVCRRLVGAQFGSLASRGYIVEHERRKSKVPTRKGAKSGVFIFTAKGRAKLVGRSAGEVRNSSPAPGENVGLDAGEGERLLRKEGLLETPVVEASVESGDSAASEAPSPAASDALPVPEPLSLFGGQPSSFDHDQRAA
jgi:hypothetical protein